MPQFPRRSTLPMSPESYRAAARRLRKMADDLEARCTPQTPREQAALTSTLTGIARYTWHLVCRHKRLPILVANREDHL